MTEDPRNPSYNRHVKVHNLMSAELVSAPASPRGSMGGLTPRSGNAIKGGGGSRATLEAKSGGGVVSRFPLTPGRAAQELYSPFRDHHSLRTAYGGRKQTIVSEPAYVGC